MALKQSCRAGLVGQLGKMWAFLCDEAKTGAADPKVLQVGLLFQEALDGKLRAGINSTIICEALGLPVEGPPPHWHEDSLCTNWASNKDK